MRVAIFVIAIACPSFAYSADTADDSLVSARKSWPIKRDLQRMPVAPPSGDGSTSPVTAPSSGSSPTVDTEAPASPTTGSPPTVDSEPPATSPTSGSSPTVDSEPPATSPTSPTSGSSPTVDSEPPAMSPTSPTTGFSPTVDNAAPTGAPIASDPPASGSSPTPDARPPVNDQPVYVPVENPAPSSRPVDRVIPGITDNKSASSTVQMFTKIIVLVASVFLTLIV